MLLESSIALREFLAQGGEVLYAILLTSILLWILISERYLYLWFSFKPDQEAILRQWQAWPKKSGFVGRHVRQTYIASIRAKLNQNLHLIKALIAVCPLLGILGTVSGMIEIFDLMSITGTGDARGMASGIARATLPTMSGLVVALSGIYFASRLESISRQRTALTTDLLAN